MVPMVPDELLDDVARRFALLSDRSRLRVLGHLHEVGPASVNELAAELGLTQPNVSQHLSKLAAAGVVDGCRYGVRVVYRISDPAVIALCNLVCRSERARIRQLAGRRTEAT
jgi:DNA-binding transcriptional ArsR family regulator